MTIRSQGPTDPLPVSSQSGRLDLLGTDRVHARPWPARYHMLDGWRGVAAIVVVGFHAFAWPFGHEAVMLFFVISGYCITAAAVSASRRRLGFRSFMWRRIRRIYPPYLFSIAFYTATRLAAERVGRGGQLSRYGPVAWLQNLTLTQWWSMVRHPVPFAADNQTNMITVYWSLGYEEQFYLVIAGLIALSFVRPRWVVFVGLALAAAAVAWNLVSPHACYGFFIEYWLHFAVGAVLFFRLCVVSSKARSTIDGLLAALFTAGVARCFYGADTGHERLLGREWAIVAGFALFLVALRRFDDTYRRAAVGRLLSALGLISFSLYLVHQCDLRFAFLVANRVWPRDAQAEMGSFHAVNGVLQLIVHLAIATAFWYACERPFLNRTLVPDRTPEPT